MDCDLQAILLTKAYIHFTSDVSFKLMKFLIQVKAKESENSLLSKSYTKESSPS